MSPSRTGTYGQGFGLGLAVPNRFGEVLAEGLERVFLVGVKGNDVFLVTELVALALLGVLGFVAEERVDLVFEHGEQVDAGLEEQPL